MANYTNNNFSEEVKLAKQFFDLFTKHYQESLSNDSDGFELQISDTETKEEIFSCKIWGDCYDNLKNPDYYTKVLVNLSTAFVIAFKNHYKLA